MFLTASDRDEVRLSTSYVPLKLRGRIRVRDILKISSWSSVETDSTLFVVLDLNCTWLVASHLDTFDVSSESG